MFAKWGYRTDTRLVCFSIFVSRMLQHGYVDVKHTTVIWQDQAPVDSAKCWLSLWQGEVRGPFSQQNAHMSPLCYLNWGTLPHPHFGALIFNSVAAQGAGASYTGDFSSPLLEQQQVILDSFLMAAVMTTILPLTKTSLAKDTSKA